MLFSAIKKESFDMHFRIFINMSSLRSFRVVSPLEIYSFALVYLVIDRGIRFEPLQSDAGKKLLRRSGRAPDDISSVVLVEKDRFVYYRFSLL